MDTGYSTRRLPILLVTAVLLVGCRSTYHKAMEEFAQPREVKTAARLAEAQDAQIRLNGSMQSLWNAYRDFIAADGAAWAEAYGPLRTAFEAADAAQWEADRAALSAADVMNPYIARQAPVDATDVAAQWRAFADRMDEANESARRALDAIRDQILPVHEMPTQEHFLALQSAWTVFGPAAQDAIEASELAVIEADATLGHVELEARDE